MKLIWAEDRMSGIGINNMLPWHLPEDLAHFKSSTAGSAMIMGRKTFESLPGMLPGRKHVVLTRGTILLPAGVAAFPCLADAYAQHPDAWVIGGGQVFAEAMAHASVLLRTVIDGDFGCDAFAPNINGDLVLVDRTAELLSKTGLSFHVERWEAPAQRHGVAS